MDTRLKTVAYVYCVIEDIANTVYDWSVNYVVDIDGACTLVDCDIRSAIESEIYIRRIRDNESIRGPLYELMVKVNSMESELYAIENISLEWGMYDCVVSTLSEKYKAIGYTVLLKLEDDNDYCILECLENDEWCVHKFESVEEQPLRGFIVSLPYDLIYIY